jgi:ferredoxin
MSEYIPKRLGRNAAGKYFTNENCDGCAYCASVAPDHFDYERESNTYFIMRQPEGFAEEEAVLEAVEDCPLDAIQSADGVHFAMRMGVHSEC